MPITGLDKPCGTCGRRSGDHSLDEWAVCMGTMTTDLPFEEMPDDTAAAATKMFRERFGGIDDDTVVADGCVVRAATLDGHAGQAGIKMPALIHEFQVGIAGQPPVPVAKVLYLADVGGMRAYGRLVRDSANGASNRAEGT